MNLYVDIGKWENNREYEVKAEAGVVQTVSNEGSRDIYLHMDMPPEEAEEYARRLTVAASEARKQLEDMSEDAPPPDAPNTTEGSE